MGCYNLVLGDQSCPAGCDLTDCNPLSSSVPGVIPTRILERIAFPPPGDLPDPGINCCVLCLMHLQKNSFTSVPHGKPKSTLMSFLMGIFFFSSYEDS